MRQVHLLPLQKLPYMIYSVGSSARAAVFGSFAAITLFSSSAIQAAEKIQFPGFLDFTTDGKQIVFDWADDVWIADSEGGEAKRLTHHAAPDSNPRISRDGKTIFFNSTRTGSLQVFQMPIVGGSPEQITFHTEGSFLEDLHPKKNAILVSGIRDHAGRQPTRLIEKPLDITRDEKVLIDVSARSGRYSPDGKNVLISREGTRTYRKGYKGSQAGRIWLYNLETKSFSEPVSDTKGCRYPVWARDGKSFHYVSGRSGSYNLWEHRLAEKSDRQLTEFLNDTTFYPQLSRDGSTLMFRHLFDYYKLSTKEGSKPEKINLFHRSTLEHPEAEALTIKSTRDATVTATGLEWAFVAEGELWAMDTVLKEPRRLTDSPAHETDIYFSEKGDFLYYLKDNGITANYWRVSKNNAKEFWWQATDLKHEPVTNGAAIKSNFRLSPKGTYISYVEYPGTLFIAKPDGSEARELLSEWTQPDYVWSPDEKHLAYAASDSNFNRDIFIIATDGESEPVNVSRHPDNEYSPRWSPDGKILAFSGRRHSASTDLFFVHLKEESHFKRDRDSRLDSAKKAMKKDPAYKEKEKTKEEPKKEEKPRKKKDDKESEEATEEGEVKEESKDEKEEEPPTIDFTDIHRRIQRIPLSGLSPSHLHWMPDSKYLTFQTNGSIYRVQAKAGSKPSSFFKGTGTIVRFKDTDKVYAVSGGRPSYLNRGKLIKYSFSIPFSRNRESYQRIGFRIAWRTIRDQWYDPALNHRDWDQVREKYELLSAQAPTKLAYGRVLNMMLGELNGSHLGYYPTNWPGEWSFDESWRSSTAHLGVRLDSANRVTFVHPKGPADRPQSQIKIGEQILKIDGKLLRLDTPLTQLLNGRMDRDITLTISSEKGDKKEECEVIIRPISYGQARLLAQNARLDERLKKVGEASDGKLGYLHVARMAWDEFEKFEHHIYERGSGKDGLIIDVRDNGGGFTADHLLTVLTQPLHAYTIPRNGEAGYPQDRHVYASWNKPIVVLCNQNSFSNAEIFSHAVKNLKRGKLVGIPTAGGVISTGSTNILGLGRMRLPFRGWFLPNGEDMEVHGAEPHFIVDLQPDDLPKGNDHQLTKAIEVLKQEVTEKGRALAKPIYRTERK
ncbi:S41 family peptidase [Akkermansiaceae bacterium]|nr:S41 family peptidase [Akkermansiaceae bacterium]